MKSMYDGLKLNNQECCYWFEIWEMELTMLEEYIDWEYEKLEGD